MPTATHPARILLGDRDRTTLKILESILPHDAYEITATDKGSQVLAYASARPPALILIDSELPGSDGQNLIRRLRENEATRAVPIVLLTEDDRVPARLAAFEAGVDDYVVKPFHPKELSFRIRNLVERRGGVKEPEAQPPAGARGRIIAFFGTKGGIGKTTLSINFAAALCARGAKRVVIVDADFAMGTVGVSLDLPPVHTISELVDRFEQLDEDLLAQVLVPHATGMRVLQSPLSPEQSESITADHVRRILQALSSTYDYIVVDCQANYDERILSILEMADDVMFITSPEIHVLKNSVSFFELVSRMELNPDKFQILLNRADSNQALKHLEIEKALKRQIDFEVRSDGRALLASANRGVPLVLYQPHHPISVEIFKMANTFLQMPQLGVVKEEEEKDKGQVRPKGRTFTPKILAAARS